MVAVTRDSIRPFAKNSNLPDTKSSLFRAGYKKYSSFVVNQSIQHLRKVFYLLNPEQDSNLSSSLKHNTGVTANHRYATLPGLQPLHDGDSSNKRYPQNQYNL